ncbi:MAG: alcohol dehydrogenase catalytic domain-containing protein [Ilumatobacteraceae bacterium]|nr:alcohol dehydrogenase catalytic domain-containing protein [Ilumatobacteraceae bacterium]
MTTARAAVLREAGSPLTLETIRIDPPKDGEVIVEMGAVGLCGSDRFVLDGHYPVEPPAVCGHEGAGKVLEVGPGVTGLTPGDHVVQIFIGPCGDCGPCRRGLKTFCRTGMHPSGRLRDGTFRMFAGDEPIGTYLGLGSFSTTTVTPARHLVKVPADVPWEIAALVSCGVSTGVGAAVNVARVRPGDSVLVVGLGGVGASAVMGAVLAGAARVVVSEVSPDKLAMATTFGATDTVDVTQVDLVEAIADLTDGNGVDAVLLTPDRVRAAHHIDAVNCLGPGGVVVQVGGTAVDLDVIPVSPNALLSQQKSITGTVIGGPDPARDVRRWIELYRAGRLPIDRLITRRYAFDDINVGFDDLKAGTNVRGVISFAP